MTSQHLNRILCIGQPADSSDGAERILEAATAPRAEAIALVGDLAHDPDGYRDLVRDGTCPQGSQHAAKRSRG